MSFNFDEAMDEGDVIAHDLMGTFFLEEVTWLEHCFCRGGLYDACFTSRAA